MVETNIILILYPKEFLSNSKFIRKISKITKNMNSFSLYYFNDFNNFVKDFKNESDCVIEIKKVSSFENVSHVIIFDDGEEFPKELEYCKLNNIPHRVIKILITRVINLKNDPNYDKNNEKYAYIGRGSYWGNPYSLLDNNYDDNARENVISQFRYDFETDSFPKKKKSEVYKLSGKRLACFCKPKACHGDVLADYLNGLDDGK